MPVEDIDRYKLTDKYESIRGRFQLIKLDSASLGYIKSLDYGIVAPDGTQIFPNKDDKKVSRWRWSKDKLKWGIENDFVQIKKDSNGDWAVYTKQYLNCDKDGNILPRTIQPIGVISKFSTTQSNKLMKKIFGGAIFNYSKPYELIEYLIKIATNENSIILDFFSGSATTAHATMKLNSEDKSTRNFILVQIPEETDENSGAYKSGYRNICEIGKERIHKAGDKIKSESNKNDLDIGFKVFKLDSSNLNKWNPDYNDVQKTLMDSVDNVVSGRSELDIVYEIMIKYGIDLTLAIEKYDCDEWTIYSVGYGALLICLDNNITKEIADFIIKLKNKLNPVTLRVVFKDNGFKGDSDKTNIKETLKTNGIDEFITI
ncbi:MAG: site-specific DNA-methyltransferase [Methanobrevibacter sp.]|nr:site-specific DNA-methyltransferase [Candidatus Methanoflexus mossambicus]